MMCIEICFTEKEASVTLTIGAVGLKLTQVDRRTFRLFIAAFSHKDLTQTLSQALHTSNLFTA